MIKVLDKVKKISIATIILAIIGGIAFIAAPEFCQKYISLFIGVAFISVGLTGIAVSLIGKNSYFLTVLGVISVIIGIIICFKYKEIAAVIIVIIGAFMVASGLTDFFTSLKVLISSRFFGLMSMALSIVTVVFGFIAIFKAFEAQEMLIRILGVALLIYAVMDIVAFIEVKAIVRKVRKAAEEKNRTGEIETTGEIVENNVTEE